MDAVGACLVLPEGYAEALRARLALPASEPLRISYLSGPGDVVGTYGHWRARRFDPRVPIIAYSTMFYEFAHQIGATAQIVTPHAPPETAAEGISFAQVARRPGSGRLGYWRSQRRFAADCVAVVDRFAPHVVVAVTDIPVQAWAGLSRGRVLVLSAHNSFWPMGRPPSSLKGRVARRRLMGAARALDGAVCTSHECMRQVADVTGGRIRGTVACPQLVAAYDARPRDRVRRLIYLGRIEEAKGVFLLLEAVGGLLERHPDLTLTLAGSGRASTALQSRISAMGTSRIRYLGALESEAVHRELAEADLLVCPTTTRFNEGLAVVGFEAAAHGVPSVLSSVVPARDLLGPSAAVVEPDDAEALRRTLRDLIEDEARYAALVAALPPVAASTRDRTLSWGSRLAQAMLEAAPDLRHG
jgi:glycogen(starch) synthase